MSVPQYGQRSDPSSAPQCPRHPGVRSVDYCKRCNRPMCVACLVPTEVCALCVDCAGTPTFSRSSATPGVTKTLIGLCAFFALVGFMLPSVERLFLFSPAFAAIQPWRFLTTAFLHSGIVHLFLNMLALYWVGSPLEKIFGHWRFAAIYLLSAIGGSAFVLMWVLVQPSTVYTATVGASGAVFGLFGALFVVQREAGMDTRAVLVLVAANLAYGFIASNVSWQSHLGGLIVGALVAFLLIRQGRAKGGITAKEQESQAMLMTGAIFLGMCAFITLIYKVLFGVLS